MQSLSSRRTPVSESLREFVAEQPYERGPILDFVAEAAAAVEPGGLVLDVGAGDAPYRELFGHVTYMTVDWEHSVHEGALESDVVASADSLPIDDAACDAVLLTQVLEHVPDPRQVLAEIRRVLRPGGSLYLTAPLVWELHEQPFDYYRFTNAGLRVLVEAAGFEGVRIRGRNDCFTTVAQLLRNMGHIMGRRPDGLDACREEVAAGLIELADRIAQLAPLDASRILPLGYTLIAQRPDKE
jgi:SAM-dependent methyltransferase